MVAGGVLRKNRYERAAETEHERTEIEGNPMMNFLKIMQKRTKIERK